jgi:hypothetical protein
MPHIPLYRPRLLLPPEFVSHRTLAESAPAAKRRHRWCFARRTGPEQRALTILDATLPARILKHLGFDGTTLEADAVLDVDGDLLERSALHRWSVRGQRALVYLEFAARPFDERYLLRTMLKAAYVRQGSAHHSPGWTPSTAHEPLLVVLLCASMNAAMRAMFDRWYGCPQDGMYVHRERHVVTSVVDLRRLPVDDGTSVLRFLRPTRSLHIWRKLIRHLHDDRSLSTDYRNRLFDTLESGVLDMNTQQRTWTWREAMAEGARRATLALAASAGASPEQLQAWRSLVDPEQMQQQVGAWLAKRS